MTALKRISIIFELTILIMKKYLLIVIILTCLGLTASATNSYSSTKLSIDTLKKGKNYILFSKTKNVQNVIFSKSKKSTEQKVMIHFGIPTAVPVTKSVFSTTIDVEKKYKEEDAANFVFDKIYIAKGKYANVETTKETFTRNLFTFTGVEFPLRLQLTSKDQVIDLELTEAGEWDINIELKNN